MKKTQLIGLILLLIGGFHSQNNWARGGHGGGHMGGHGGFRGYYRGGYYGLGLGFGYPYYGYGPGYGYSYGFPYYSSAGYLDSPPPVHYIQQPPAPVIEYPPGYWYFCGNPQGYYPQLKECPTAWLQVPPLPASGP